MNNKQIIYNMSYIENLKKSKIIKTIDQILLIADDNS